MPEIAEVAVYAHDINKLIQGKKLKRVEFKGEARWQDVIVPKPVRSILKSWEGRNITFKSLGKTLYLNEFKSKEAAPVQFKLGMTGMFQINSPTADGLSRHSFIVFEFETKKEQTLKLYYLDYRRFGRVGLAKDEPLAIAGFDGQKFFTKDKSTIALIVKKLKGFKNKPRISWLLEQGVRTGVGNYLANEALGKLKLSPFDPCKNEEEATKLLFEVAKISQKSFDHGGNSFKGGYYRLTGELGDFFKYCKFYRNMTIKCFNFRGRPVYTHFDPPMGLKGFKKS
jgi:formamidopyrimidine-DNA glycosylase